MAEELAPEKEKKHILVIGATGPTGLAFLPEALKGGYKLTIIARTPSKLPEEIRSSSEVTIFESEFSNEEKMKEAVASGPNIFVSFAGPTLGKWNKGTPISDAHKLLLPLLIENKYTRALILLTPSFSVPEDKSTLKWFMGRLFVRATGGSAFNDFVSLGNFITSEISPEQLRWTIFRVPLLNNNRAEGLDTNVGFVGGDADRLTLSRESLINWVLQEMEDGKWIGKAPMLSNQGII